MKPGRYEAFRLKRWYATFENSKVIKLYVRMTESSAAKLAVDYSERNGYGAVTLKCETSLNKR